MMLPASLKLSVVIPVYSGAPYLEELIARLAQLRQQWTVQQAPIELLEVIAVDDAAVDSSAEVLGRLAVAHSWLRTITLSRNFGSHPATVAGILHTVGDWVVTLDEDLQHPPELIPQMLRQAVCRRLDIVYVRSTGKVHGNFFRDLTSVTFKRLMAWALNDSGFLRISSFRLIRGAVARAAASVCGHETYLDVALSWFADRVGSLEALLRDVRTTRGGRSGYSVSKLLSHGRRFLLSSRTRLLRVGLYLGVSSLVLSLITVAYLVIREWLDPGSFGIRGWASGFAATVFYGGMALFLLGVALEYLMSFSLQAQGKPTFFVVDRSSDQVLLRFFQDQLPGDAAS